MNILIYCPSPVMREVISRYLIDVGNHQLFFAETEPLTVSIALYNEIGLLLLFDPAHTGSMVHLQEFLRQKKRKMRVRILPAKHGESVLMPGWQKPVNAALRPAKKRKSSFWRTNPRFSWKPKN